MGIRITVIREERPTVSRWRRLTKRSLLAVLGAAALAAGAGGMAIATIPSAKGTFYGCYTVRTGALRLINPSQHQTCKAGERQISWSQDELTWEGAWSPTTSYAVDDAVVYQGSSYLAKKPNANKVPSASPHDWALLASAGTPGPPGPGFDFTTTSSTNATGPTISQPGTYLIEATVTTVTGSSAISDTCSVDLQPANLGDSTELVFDTALNQPAFGSQELSMSGMLNTNGASLPGSLVVLCHGATIDGSTWWVSPVNTSG
jgi:hypothetical protein